MFRVVLVYTSTALEVAIITRIKFETQMKKHLCNCNKRSTDYPVHSNF